MGLGKTHLINAVANELLEKKHVTIAYRTSERFTNELIQAIRNGSTQQFRNRYRKVDVLIIDDVQFIAGKASTQEEFLLMTARPDRVAIRARKPCVRARRIRLGLNVKYGHHLAENIPVISVLTCFSVRHYRTCGKLLILIGHAAWY